MEITPTALAAIREHTAYIANDAASPANAARWLRRVLDAIDSLSRLPRRTAKAQEDDYFPFEVRRLVVGNHLLLFTVDDEENKVWILGVRHGSRRPRPEDLKDPHDDDG